MTRDEFHVFTTVIIILISFFALGFTVWQGMKAREHNLLSVKPYLNVIVDNQPDYIELKVANYGLGPAIVRHLQRFSNGKAVSALEFEKDVRKHLDEGDKYNFFYERKSFVVPVNDSISIYKVKFNGRHDKDLSELLAKSFDVDFDYTSAYDKTSV